MDLSNISGEGQTISPRFAGLGGAAWSWRQLGCGLAVVGGGLLLITGALAAASEKPAAFTPSAEVSAAVAGNTALAFDLYAQVKGQPGNLFFSPYSISTALALVYAGAHGPTESEMAKALHFDQPQMNLHAAFATLNDRLGRIQRWRSVALASANSLWCQPGDPFTSAFLAVAGGPYEAETHRVDFKSGPELICAKFNAWVEAKTHGKIKKLAAPGLFTPDTSLVVCSAIYFKGKWATKFKPGDTQPAPFHLVPDKTVSVPMMSQKGEFRRVSIEPDSGNQIIELPYFGRDLSMIILLPATVDGLPALEQALTIENLQVWMKKLAEANPTKVVVRLPRFSMMPGFDLTRSLKALGMTRAFDKGAADFSGIDGQNNLYLCAALHQAFVEVNEEGTEAAAATLLEAKSRSMTDQFSADHPFIFLIRENGSGSILFLGRLIDPAGA